MHQPDSDRTIEITIDGEIVSGTVHHDGAADISVRLDQPVNRDWTDSLHMPYFARPVHREGFLGEYGEQRARDLLVSLYKLQKKGDRRRTFAGPDFEEFGRVRYLAINPGHPARGVRILEKTGLDALVHVQLESAGPYRRARFFDSVTDQPFLAESAVYEENIQAYVDGVKADLGFSRHLQTVRLKLLPKMIEDSGLLKTYRISPDQADFLSDFGENWRQGKMPLNAAEIEQLIQLGYLTRNTGLAAAERAALEVSLARTRKAMENFEARGKKHQAAECRAKVQKLERRIDCKTLMITPAGKAAVKKLPYQVEFDDDVF
jgi:hypothetical protein